MSLPLISVIVPVFNNEKYLSGTLKALSNQTYKNLEVILVNDGSVDSSLEICENFAKNHPNFIVLNQENKGVSVARNYGMTVAKGEYIAFCDGDDLPDNDLYETLYNLAVENNSEISTVNLRIVFENGKININHYKPFKLWTSTKDFVKDFLTEFSSMSACIALFKKDVCVPFPQGKRLNEDMFFYFNCALKANRIVYKDIDKYSYFRRKGSSTFIGFSDKFFDSIDLVKEIAQTVNNQFPEYSHYATGKQMSVTLRVLNRIYVLKGKTAFKDKEKELVKYLRSHKITFAKQVLTQKNFIRFMCIKFSRIPFALLCKFFDKN